MHLPVRLWPTSLHFLRACLSPIFFLLLLLLVLAAGCNLYELIEPPITICRPLVRTPLLWPPLPFVLRHC